MNRLGLQLRTRAIEVACARQRDPEAGPHERAFKGLAHVDLGHEAAAFRVHDPRALEADGETCVGGAVPNVREPGAGVGNRRRHAETPARIHHAGLFVAEVPRGAEIVRFLSGELQRAIRPQKHDRQRETRDETLHAQAPPAFALEGAQPPQPGVNHRMQRRQKLAFLGEKFALLLGAANAQHRLRVRTVPKGEMDELIPAAKVPLAFDPPLPGPGIFLQDLRVSIHFHLRVGGEKRPRNTQARERLIGAAGVARDKMPSLVRLKIDDPQHQAARVVRQHTLEQLQVRPPETLEVERPLQVQHRARGHTLGGCGTKGGDHGAGSVLRAKSA